MDVIDLFCGAGGLSLGLEKAGLNIICGVDLDKDSIETFAASHNGAEAVCSDVLAKVEGMGVSSPRLRATPLVLVGGPPCQGFCSINPSRNINDPRNSCVDMFLRAVEILKPDFVLMENVTGLLSLGKGYAKKKLEATLTSFGFSVSYKVLQAAHYGAPQNRWRLFVVASKNGSFQYPEPTHFANIKANVAGGRALTFTARENDLFENLANPLTVWDAISDLPELGNGSGALEMPYQSPPKSKLQESLRGDSPAIYNHQCQNLGPINMERVKLIEEGGNWQSLPRELTPKNIQRSAEKWGRFTPTRFGRLRKDGFFSTVLTKPEPYWGAFIHPEQDRLISVREMARAQTFPDRVRFYGNLASQYRQVGNAVPVVLGEALGFAVIQHF